jgi:hypothetical protein
MTAKPKDSRHSASEYVLNFVESIYRTIGAHFFTDGLPSCLTLNQTGSKLKFHLSFYSLRLEFLEVSVNTFNRSLLTSYSMLVNAVFWSNICT